MHDPSTVAHEIRWPFGGTKTKLKDGTVHRHRPLFITIWHEDPETDGTDDSCGWFIRGRHCDKAKLDKLYNDFAFDWDADYGGWFNKDGSPRYSVISIALQMFGKAAYVYYGDWDKAHNFIQKNLYKLMRFAENHFDSLHPFITNRYGERDRGERIRTAVSIVYPYVCRELQPWYRHARWHVHHWRIQFHPWQNLKRRYWDKCCACGKRGFPPGVGAIGDWSGEKIWHDTCRETKAAMDEAKTKTRQ